MKIVVLDGASINPGDIGWDALEALGECTVYDHTSGEDILARSAGAAVLLTNRTRLDGETIAALPALRYIGLFSTGVNTVDLDAARAHGVTVTNVPAYSTASVAQATIALLLELANGTGFHAGAVRDGHWTAGPDAHFRIRQPVELDGLELGLVGFGNIARQVAKIAQALGMKIVVHTRTADLSMAGIDFVSLDLLFATADVVSLHCPLTEETRNLVNAERLRLMKPTAWLINTARGGLVDEDALAAALNSGAITGAGLDVLSREPPPADNPLLSAKNCIITPHIAWASLAARRRLLDEAVANLAAFTQGGARNVVS